MNGNWAPDIYEGGRVREEEVVEVPEYELDLNNLPKVKHNFIRRGVVISCENAGHPNHRHFLTSKRDIATDAKRTE